MQVLVRDNNVDQALKVLKKKMQREGVFREMKLRGHYEKPSEKKAREKAEAIRRARKLARKKLQREGLLPMKPKPTGPGGPGRPWCRQVRPAARAPFRLTHKARFSCDFDDGAGVCSPASFFAARRWYRLACSQECLDDRIDDCQCRSGKDWGGCHRACVRRLGPCRLHDAGQSACRRK